jgi:hypothetical protein
MLGWCPSDTLKIFVIPAQHWSEPRFRFELVEPWRHSGRESFRSDKSGDKSGPKGLAFGIL